jgi:hypothetical protein
MAFHSNRKLNPVGAVDVTDADHVYFNAVIPHSGKSFVTEEATFSQKRSSPILADPSMYHVAIENFSIPGLGIPVLIFKPQTGQPNPDLGIYSVTMEWVDGSPPTIANNSQEFLEFERTSFNVPVPVAPLSVDQLNNPYYFVYEFEHMIRMINDALNRAFFSLQGKIGGAFPTGAVPPYLEYDAETQLISLIAQRPYYDRNKIGPHIRIWVNTPLYTLLQGIDVNYYGEDLPLGRDQFILVDDTLDNHYEPSNNPLCDNYQGGWNANTNVPALASVVGVGSQWYIVSTAGATTLDGNTNWLVGEVVYFYDGAWYKYANTNCIPSSYLRIEQNYNALNNWYDFKSLVITTDMPIVREFVPESGQTLSTNQTVAGTVARSVLTSFNPNLVRAGDNRGTLIYASQQYRLIDFNTHNPLYNVTLRVWWQDRQNNLYPVLLNYGTSAQIKLVFIRKSLEK